MTTSSILKTFQSKQTNKQKRIGQDFHLLAASRMQSFTPDSMPSLYVSASLANAACLKSWLRHAADPRNLGCCRLIGFASEFGSSCNYHRFMAILLMFCYPNRLPVVA
jgi:hypothetical protein